MSKFFVTLGQGPNEYQEFRAELMEKWAAEVEQRLQSLERNVSDTTKHESHIEYIRLDETLSLINELDNRNGFKSYQDYSILYDQIRDLPCVHVDQKVCAEWIQVDDDRCKCSNCDHTFLIAVYPSSGNNNFCPNCGAAMNKKVQ